MITLFLITISIRNCKDQSDSQPSSNSLLPGEYEWQDPKTEDEVYANHLKTF